MGRRRNCTVVYVDEFRTTKLCSFCFKELEQPTRYGRVHKKNRFYTCRQCVKHERAHEAVGWVTSRKSNRLLTKQRIEHPRRGVRRSSKFKLYRKTEVELDDEDVPIPLNFIMMNKGNGRLATTITMVFF